MPSVFTLVPSAARNANGSSITSQVQQEYLSIITAVTAASGTLPSLTVTVQWSHDGTTWADDAAGTDSFGPFATVGAKVSRIAVKGPWMRVAWSISGAAPSITFSVTAF